MLALGLPLAALAYFLAAPALPMLTPGDTTVLVAGTIGVLVIAASTLALLPAHDMVIGPLLIVLGAGLLMGALNAAHVGAAANPVEALVAAAVGLLFARFMRAPAYAITVPLFVALIDAWSVASGPTSLLIAAGTTSDDPLSFDLPAWGGGASAGHIGLSDAVFLAMYAGWAQHFGFRRVPTIVGLVLGLVAAVVLGVALDRAIPALPLLATGYLLPNADRIGRLLRPD